MEYQEYQTKWITTLDEELKTIREPNKPLDKCAVAVTGSAAVMALLDIL